MASTARLAWPLGCHGGQGQHCLQGLAKGRSGYAAHLYTAVNVGFLAASSAYLSSSSRGSCRVPARPRFAGAGSGVPGQALRARFECFLALVGPRVRPRASHVTADIPGRQALRLGRLGPARLQGPFYWARLAPRVHSPLGATGRGPAAARATVRGGPRGPSLLWQRRL
jgi:hypothetical protein